MRRGIVYLLMGFLTVSFSVLSEDNPNIKSAASVEKTDPEKFEEVITYYYLNPQPQRIPQVLESLLSSEFFKSQKDIKLLRNVAYAFGRLLELNPNLLDKYVEIFQKYPGNGRSFILDVLELSRVKAVQDFLKSKLNDPEFSQDKERIQEVVSKDFSKGLNILGRDIDSPEVLDFLWSEFIVTGSDKPVLRVLDALGKPDVFRKKLSEFLLSDKDSFEKDKIKKILTDNLEIFFDDKGIVSKEDLDVLFTLYLQNSKGDPESLKEVINALGLSKEDLYYMAIKGSANWSLNSNARQHEKVLQILSNDLNNRPVKTKIDILRILAQVYYLNDKLADSFEALKQLVTITPYDPEVHLRLGLIFVEQKKVPEAISELKTLEKLDSKRYEMLNEKINLLQLETLNVSQATLGNVEGGIDNASLLKSIIESMKKVASYGSHMSLEDFNKKVKFKDNFVIEWDFQYKSPDRFFVDQTAWETEGPLYDRWITIGEDNYFQIGPWFKDTADTASARKSTNGYISANKWIYLLEKNQPQKISLYTVDDKSYYVIDLVPTDVKDFWLVSEGDKIEFSSQIWVDKNDLRIVKADLKVSGALSNDTKVNMLYQQIFIGYDSDIVIEVPKDVYNFPNKQQTTN